MNAWAKDRVAELSARISEVRIVNEYVGQGMLHGFLDEPGSNFEGSNINLGMMLGLCIKANEDNQKEIERLRRVFGV